MPYPKRIEKTKEELLNEGYKLIDSTFEGEKLEKWYIKYDEDNKQPIIFNNIDCNYIKIQNENNNKRKPFIVFYHKKNNFKVNLDRLLNTYLDTKKSPTNFTILKEYKGEKLKNCVKVYKNGCISRIKKRRKTTKNNKLNIFTFDIEENYSIQEDENGYNRITIHSEKKQYCVFVHRLVIYAFCYREDYENLQVDHINHNKTDNRLENLRWTTHMENQLNRRINNNSIKQIQKKKFDINEKQYISNVSGHKYICYNNNRKCWNLNIRVNGKQIQKKSQSKTNLICYKYILLLRILSGHYGDIQKNYFTYSELFKGEQIIFRHKTEEDINNIKLKIKELRNNNPEITGQEIREIFNIKKRKRPKNKLYDSPDIENVEKKELDNYSKYTFYSNGKIWSKSSGKFLERLSDNNGYINSVFVNDLNERKDWSFHRIIATCFIPNPENKPYVDHKNRNKNDNSVENLRWVTPQENANNRH